MGKKIAAATVAFIMAVLVAALGLILATWVALLSPGGIKRSYAKSDYYAGMQRYLENKTSAAMIPTGLPESLLEDIFKPDALAKIAEGGSADGMRVQFRENIVAYLAAEGLLGQVSEENIDSVVDGMLGDIETSIRLPGSAMIARLQATAGRYILLVAVGLVLLVAAAGLIIWRVEAGWPHRALRQFSFALIGGGLMTGLVPGVGLASGLVKRLQITPEYFYTFFVHHIQGWLLTAVLAGVACIAAGVVCSVIAEKRRDRLRRRKHHVA